MLETKKLRRLPKPEAEHATGPSVLNEPELAPAAPPMGNIDVRRMRPAKQLVSISTRLSPETANGIKAFAIDNDITVAEVFERAWAALQEKESRRHSA